jgi:hypothetical protein
VISSKFKFLDNNLTKIVTALQSNQKLMKYLVYLTDDPLAQQTVDRAGKSVLQPDIHYSLIDNYIILDDYDESVLKKQRYFCLFILLAVLLVKHL